MPLYLKLALGNVRRGARDYSVYFATLGFAACLLYSFVASTDHLRVMGLSPEQLGVLGSAGDILQAFSVFTVLVFLFLVRYANRFLLRRRKRDRAAPADRAHVRRARAGAHAPRRPGRAGRPGGARRGPARGGMGLVRGPTGVLHRAHQPHGLRRLLRPVARRAPGRGRMG